MQESGPRSPAGREPSQGRTADERRRVTNGARGNPATRSRPAQTAPHRRVDDPVIARLKLAIIVVIVTWLAGILSAVMFGTFNLAHPPRTSTENEIEQFAGVVQSGKAGSQTYARYVDTLVRAGQLSKAQQALDKAIKVAKTDKSYLYAQQARLSFAQKDYKGAVAAADKAMAEAKKELKAFKAANVAANRNPNAAAVMPDSFSTAALAKADALVQSKDYANAIKAYDSYVKVRPVDSDVLVQRASVKVRIGDKKGAEADYRVALKYIPDYKPALDGLKQIGVPK